MYNDDRIKADIWGGRFRPDHTPMVLTGETREMQENGTPAKYPLYIEIPLTAPKWLRAVFFYPKRGDIMKIKISQDFREADLTLRKKDDR